jgi:conjugative transfer pilus assembly protein TraH
MELAPNGIGAQLRNLARHDEGLARIFAKQAAPVIALEMAQLIMSDLLRAAENALAMGANAYTAKVAEQIKGAREQVHREYAVLAERYGNAQTLLAYYQDLPSSMRSPCSWAPAT